LTDPQIAPPGKHVMSCFVQYRPTTEEKGTWDDQREEFGDTVIDTIAEHAPNIKTSFCTGGLTPLDLERGLVCRKEYLQGELTLEQLFFSGPRRLGAISFADSQSLHVRSATHPGGGIMGASGRNAAMRFER